MKKPAIQFIDYSFQYRAQSEPTLHDLNLTIHEGEKVLIVGPSGSGKSTLAHSINGLVPFFYAGEVRGELRIGGLRAAELGLRQISGMVGTVLQDADGQFVGLTVAEDIAFKLENEGRPQAEMIAQVAQAARTVGMEDHLGASPHDLSGGQKQRTTIAGVIVDHVDILLFDEPLAYLDPLTGKQAIELIDRIHRETGKTVIIIEHRLEDALHRPVDRIIVMSEGRIVADMAPDELLSSPLLAETGIREPLYLAALKQAGCTVTPDMRPASLETIRLDVCQPRLRAWYEQNPEESAPEPGEAILEFDRVSFRYDESRETIRDLSFTVNKGEMVGIVGKNGAGKSTVAKLICGFYRPDSGRILLGGSDLNGTTIKERAERIGYVMQNPNRMISKTMLYDEVAFGLRLRGMDEATVRERVLATLRLCGLYPFRNWPISALSYGQKKRVTIAAMLVLRPEILILDEPTAGQDFRHYNEIMEFLLVLNRQGVTILLVTHDMHLMQEYTNRAVVLADGVKIADGPPADILTDRRIVEAANLKETSVYGLAVKAGFPDPREFVRRFIGHDRRLRGR